MKKLLVVGYVLASGFSALAGVGTFSDGVLTYNVSSDTTETDTFASYGAVTQVVKQGAGKLTVQANNTGYTGTILVQAGIFYGNSFDSSTYRDLSIGSASEVRVSGGAAFDYYDGDGGWKSSAARHPNTKFYAEGAGPDGKGALRYTAGSYGEAAFTDTVLTGPTTVGGGRGPLGKKLNMNGHTLTNLSGNFLYNFVPSNPGNIVNLGKWTFGGGGNCVASGDLSLTLGNKGVFMYWSSGATITRPVTVEGTAYWRSDAGSFDYDGTGLNTCASPITLSSGSVLTFDHQQNAAAKGYYSQRFSGVISGPGAIRATNDVTKATARTYLTAKNTYTGGTYMTGGEIWGVTDQSIPLGGGLYLTGGKLHFVVGVSNGWTAEHVHDAYAACRTPAAAGTFCYMTPTAATAFTDSVNWTNSFGVLSHNGLGTCTLAGTFGTDPMEFYNHAGTFKITAGGQGLELKNVKADSGSLVFEDAGYLWISNREPYFASSNVSVPRLVLKGNTTVSGCVPPDGVSGKARSILRVGCTASQRGILEIQEGATLTNLVYVGTDSGSAGAVYQSGGKFFNVSRACYDGLFSQMGYAYYGLTGGKFETLYAIWFGKQPRGMGIWAVKGGEVSINGTSTIGGGGTGVVYQTAGAVTWKDRASLCAADYVGDGDTGRPCAGTLTLDGAAARFDLTGTGYLHFGQRTNSISQINLNAGRLSCKVIARRDERTDGKKGPTAEADIPTCRGYLNFNGGTLVARATGSIVDSAERKKLNKITVYERGAAVDVAGYTVGFPLPLEKPEGYGVKSIAFATPAAVTNFIGAQAVTFAGGAAGSIAATAIVPFDEATGELQTPVVTSAGQGFAAGDTVTAAIRGCRNTGSHALNVTLAPLASGGLTVTNSSATAGSLTLGAVNTYTGATHVCSGATLRIGVANAIAASTAVRVDNGGTLDLNGKGGITVETFDGSGAVAGGDVTVTKGLTFVAADVMADRTAVLSGKLTLAANTTLTVTDVPTDIPEVSHTLLTAAGGIVGDVPTLVGFEGAANPGRWKLVKSGNSLRLRFERGLFILLK